MQHGQQSPFVYIYSLLQSAVLSSKLLNYDILHYTALQ